MRTIAPAIKLIPFLAKLYLSKRLYNLLNRINDTRLGLNRRIVKDTETHLHAQTTIFAVSHLPNTQIDIFLFNKAKIHYPTGLIFVANYFPKRAITHPNIFNIPRYFFFGWKLILSRGKKAPDGIYIAMPLYKNYYHWLIEIFPRLLLLRPYLDEQGPPIIMPADLPRFARECVETILPPARIRYLPLGTWCCDTMLFPPRIAPYRTVTRAQVAALKSAMRPRLEEVKPRARIYLSRDDALIRRVANESTLQTVLSKYGFKVISLAGHSVAEQARLFATAQVIVAPHGAGIANIAFAQPGAILVELAPTREYDDCMKSLAEAVNVEHHIIFVEMRGYDLHVDPARLDATLAKVLLITHEPQPV